MIIIISLCTQKKFNDIILYTSQEFVSCDHWAHLDIAGVMENKDEVPYLGNGMSGRPTRTLVKLLHHLAQPDASL